MWKKFIDEFEIFFYATGLDEKPERQQVMCSLNVIGARGRVVYDAMQFTEDDNQLKIDVVKKKFAEHCIPKTKRTNRKRLVQHEDSKKR